MLQFVYAAFSCIMTFKDFINTRRIEGHVSLVDKRLMAVNCWNRLTDVI